MTDGPVEGGSLAASEISASDFSEHAGHGFRFGISAQETAAALRALADRIERREVLMERVHIVSIASRDDFLRKRVVLTIAEKLT